MFNWLKSWLKEGRAPSGRAKRRQPAGVQPGVTGTASEAGAGSPAPEGRAQLAAWAQPPAQALAGARVDEAPPAAVAVRLPLLGPDGRIAGFEFRLPDAQLARLNGHTDARAVARFAALLASTPAVLRSGRQVLVALPAVLLDRPALARLVPAGLMLELHGLAAGPDEAALGRLRARGVRLGLPDGPPRAAPWLDFVRLQGSADGTDTLRLSAQRWREAHPGLLLLASGASHLQEVEQLLRAGFGLVGGRLDLGGPALAAAPLQPAAHHLAGLLNHLALDRDTATVAEAVRADATLSYRLLRYANSAAIGAPRAVDSVDDAVQLLGRNELRRWLELMLLGAAQARQATPALQESALARGRLLELLARQRGEPEAAARARFTLGLFSMLEVLLQVPLAEALAPLRLSDALQQALLEHRGPLADELLLAVACDLGDEAGVVAAAERLGGVDPVLPLVEQAWEWAAGAAGTAVDGPAPAR